MITGPYQVDENDLETHETLDPLDLGAWYLIVNGSMIFCTDEQHARNRKQMLQAMDNELARHDTHIGHAGYEI